MLMESPTMDRNPSPPPDRDDETWEDNDAIGETTYSKHWLFSALTRLIQMVTQHESEYGEGLTELPDELEEDLCKIWDMAMDKDVVGFLQEFKTPDILLGLITKSCNPRLTEICVGILGNMVCFPDTCEFISQNDGLGAVLLLLLGDRDPPTLLETCRLLLTCVSQPDVAPLWLQRIQQQTAMCNNICFIMHSSTNVDLLIKVGELIDKLFDEDEELMKRWLSGSTNESEQDMQQEVASALLEAAIQIRKDSPKALETYLHALQLLTTVDEGLQKLVSDEECGVSLWKMVCEVVCEDLCQPDDPPLILQEQKALLASALAILSVLNANLQTNISSELVASVLRILYFDHEYQQEVYQESGQDEERDPQLQVLAEIAVELLSALLTQLPQDVVSELLKKDHLTEKSWVLAMKTLLPQHNTSVLCFVSTLSEMAPKLAAIIKEECSISLESNKPKAEPT